MSWDDDLTGVAREIAATNDSPLRVVAGPGTGKSRALKRRVARLLEAGQDPGRVLAVTFTRNAARALVDDLRDLGVPGCDAVRAVTLHAFCFSILSREDVLPRLGRVIRPLVTFTTSKCLRFEAAPLVADLMLVRAFGQKRECAARIRAFEAAWARLESETPGWPQNPTDREFQDRLLAWLKFHQSMLIGELVPEALRFLRANPASPERGAFDHVLVDEYQDLNKAEQVLVDLLAEQGCTAVVGDPDQSIYRFRFANPEGIDEYGFYHANTHDEVLDVCHRCPAGVVEMADSLIRNNHPAEAHPRLVSAPNRPRGEIAVVQWQDIDEEARGIADAVRWYVQDRNYEAKDILVLTSRRRLGYLIRNHIRAADIPVHSFYHDEPLQSELAQRAFCLLTLVDDADDRVALRWWLGTGDPAWRSREYAILRTECERTGCSPKEVLDHLTDGTLGLAGTDALVQRYRDLLATLDQLVFLSVADLVDALLPEGDDDCLAMREAALLGIDATATPGELLERLRANITQPETPEQGEYVRVMSLHKSKGLTSKVVLVAGCIEGLIPVRADREPAAEQVANMSEQRRLFYVAITRCTDALVLSSARQMARVDTHSWGAVVTPGRTRMATTIPSRFVSELGPNAPAAITGVTWARSRGRGRPA